MDDEEDGMIHRVRNMAEDTADYLCPEAGGPAPEDNSSVVIIIHPPESSESCDTAACDSNSVAVECSEGEFPPPEDSAHSDDDPPDYDDCHDQPEELDDRDDDEEDEGVDDEDLPFPGFIPVTLKVFTQTTWPRYGCLRLITNPYPFQIDSLRFKGFKLKRILTILRVVSNSTLS